MNNNTFVRVLDDFEQTAIQYLINPRTGVEIILVASCHIGNRGYYQEITARLSQANVVLYEGGSRRVSFFETCAKTATRRINRVISKTIKRLITDDPLQIEKWLRLEEKLRQELSLIAQTEGIDYSHVPPQWIKSDLSERGILEGLSGRSLLNCFMHALAVKLAQLPRWLGGGCALGLATRSLDNFLCSRDADAKNQEREGVVYANLAAAEQNDGARIIGILYGASHMNSIASELYRIGYVLNERKPTEYLTFCMTPKRALEII